MKPKCYRRNCNEEGKHIIRKRNGWFVLCEKHFLMKMKHRRELKKKRAKAPLYFENG